MRWLITLFLALVMVTGTGCVFSDDDGTPDTVVVDHDTPAAGSTTIIDNTDPAPAPDADVDVNIDTK